MVAVYKKAELPTDVLDEPEALQRAVVWAIRGLIRRCEDCAVLPIGELTVSDRTVEDEGGPVGPTRQYELILELDRGPELVTRQAVGAQCPVLDCGHAEYGWPLEVASVIGRLLKHWDLVHSAGDQFA